MQHQNPPWSYEIFKIRISILISQVSLLDQKGLNGKKARCLVGILHLQSFTVVKQSVLSVIAALYTWGNLTES